MATRSSGFFIRNSKYLLRQHLLNFDYLRFKISKYRALEYLYLFQKILYRIFGQIFISNIRNALQDSK